MIGRALLYPDGTLIWSGFLASWRHSAARHRRGHAYGLAEFAAVRDVVATEESSQDGNAIGAYLTDPVPPRRNTETCTRFAEQMDAGHPQFPNCIYVGSAWKSSPGDRTRGRLLKSCLDIVDRISAPLIWKIPNREAFHSQERSWLRPVTGGHRRHVPARSVHVRSARTSESGEIVRSVGSRTSAFKFALAADAWFGRSYSSAWPDHARV